MCRTVVCRSICFCIVPDVLVPAVLKQKTVSFGTNIPVQGKRKALHRFDCFGSTEGRLVLQENERKQVCWWENTDKQAFLASFDRPDKFRWSQKALILTLTTSEVSLKHQDRWIAVIWLWYIKQGGHRWDLLRFLCRDLEGFCKNSLI